jgi:hypothetical protein
LSAGVQVFPEGPQDGAGSADHRGRRHHGLGQAAQLPGENIIKTLFFYVAEQEAKYARAFVTGNPS